MSDLDIIRRSQAGSPEAFAILFEQYKNLVYKTAFLLLDGSRDEAEDALQEVFLLVYRGLPSYDPAKAAFTTWLHRVTVNHCMNRKRRKRPLTLSFDELPPLPSPNLPRLENLSDEDEAVRRSLHRLNEKLRPVVVLRFYWELSYAEIAQILDLPVGTVKSRLDQAVKTLRRDLIDFDPDCRIGEEVPE